MRLKKNSISLKKLTDESIIGKNLNFTNEIFLVYFFYDIKYPKKSSKTLPIYTKKSSIPL